MEEAASTTAGRKGSKSLLPSARRKAVDCEENCLSSFSCLLNRSSGFQCARALPNGQNVEPVQLQMADMHSSAAVFT